MRHFRRVISRFRANRKLAVMLSVGFHAHRLIPWPGVLILRSIGDDVLAANVVRNGARDALYFFKTLWEICYSTASLAQGFESVTAAPFNP